MTKLLTQLVEELEKRPAAEQDAIASRALAELEDDQRWEKSFDQTTDDQLAKLEAFARGGGDAGILDDLLKP